MNTMFSQEISILEPYLHEIFCKLHRHPELGRNEHKTQALILSELEKMGIKAKPIADTGVVGIIRGEKPGKTVAFRADMDALPIQEQTGLPYASQEPGVMHACGHDAHITILLGTAKLLTAHKDTLCGNVKLFFQPDEERRGGSQRMIEDGCMENPHVDAVFFGHCSADYPTGSIGVRAGVTTASSNPFLVTFRGKGTHGAMPHNGNDVIVAASQAVIALQTICSRRTDPTDSVVLSVGSFQAGSKGNVLPDTAVIRGILRTTHPKTRARVQEDFRQIITGIAAAMGVTADIIIEDDYAAVINDEEMTALVRMSAKEVMGVQHVYEMSAPTMSIEDVGYFFQKSKGCYYQLGIANADKGSTYPIHSPHFTVDLDAIAYGVALYTQIATDFLGDR